MTITEQQQSFVYKTIHHYTLNNRGTYHGGGVYRPTETSEGCPIGREIGELAKTIPQHSIPHVFHLFPKELKMLGIEFLSSIQKLHDNSKNWDRKGLSEEGKVEVVNISETFNLSIKL